MTNGDYVRAMLSDRNLTPLFGWSAVMDADFRILCSEAFERWCADFGSTTSNIKQNNPSPYYWEKVYNEDTKEWESTHRTKSVSIQIFLSKPYEERFWKNS